MSDAKEKKGRSSAEKRTIQNEKRRLRNRAEMSRVRTLVKKVLVALKEGNQESYTNLLNDAVKGIDKLKSKGIIHKNNASRNISRLTKKVNLAKSA